MKNFFNLYNHGFIRVAVCVPDVKVSDTAFNAEKTVERAKKVAA